MFKGHSVDQEQKSGNHPKPGSIKVTGSTVGYSPVESSKAISIDIP